MENTSQQKRQEKVETLQKKSNLTIGVIGLGNMGIATVEGFIRSGVLDFATVVICNRSIESTQEKLRDRGLNDGRLIIAENNEEVVSQASLLFVALKQQKMKEEFEHWRERGLLSTKTLVVSFAAGVRTDTMAKWLMSTDQPIARVMPNLPVASGRGVLGWYVNGEVKTKQTRRLEKLLECIGLSVEVKEEDKMDLITALSGSGPAYFYRLAESMVAYAVSQEMDETDARRIVRETFIGAAAHLDKTGKDLEILRREITSPGGTTMAAMSAWDEAKTEENVFAVTDAARVRGGQIGDQFDAL